MINLPKLFVLAIFTISVIALKGGPTAKIVGDDREGVFARLALSGVSFQSTAQNPINVRYEHSIAEKRVIRRSTVTTNVRVGRTAVRGDLDKIIINASKKYNADVEWMRRVMMCESGGYQYAKNPYSNASGLFQFLPSTWRTTPYGNKDIYDPEAQIYAAAWMYSVGRAHEWACK